MSAGISSLLLVDSGFVTVEALKRGTGRVRTGVDGEVDCDGVGGCLGKINLMQHKTRMEEKTYASLEFLFPNETPTPTPAAIAITARNIPVARIIQNDCRLTPHIISLFLLPSSPSPGKGGSDGPATNGLPESTLPWPLPFGPPLEVVLLYAVPGLLGLCIPGVTISVPGIGGGPPKP